MWDAVSDNVSVLHPKEMIFEYMESEGWSQRDLAEITGLPPATIDELCSGKASISAIEASAFARAFGRPAGFWLSLQQRFDATNRPAPLCYHLRYPTEAFVPRPDAGH